MMTSPPRRPATVLLVDDEAGLRRVLERFLERHGYRVLSAGTAEAAYDLLASEMADALLLDLPVALGLAREFIAGAAVSKSVVRYLRKFSFSITFL